MFNKKHTLLVIASLFVFSSAYAGEVNQTMETTSQTGTKMEEVMSSALNIVKVNPLNSSKIEVEFDKNTNTFSSGSELKVYNQLEVVEVKVSETNSKQIEIMLSGEDLTDGTVLSLISLTDLDLNADFTITGENFSLDNLATSTWSKITLKNKSTLVIDLNSDIGNQKPNLKLLKEVPVTEISNIDSKLELNLGDKLKNSNSYILMVISLLNLNNESITVENGVFDFVTPLEFAGEENLLGETSTGTLNEEVSTGVLLEETLTGSVVEEVSTGALVEEKLELNSGEETSSGELAIEDVAMSAEATPDTGTKEIFIVLLSLMIGLGFFALKNKRA